MINRLAFTSPNFGERKNNAVPHYIILHFTGMEGAKAACQRLCDPKYEVSAHYLIAEDGTVLQLVDEAKRAWHAGASYWAGETDLNSASIGVELDNNGARPFTDLQYDALIELLKGIQLRYNIPPQNVLGHMDIALGRKFDPGPWFDWARLDIAGVSQAPKARIKSRDFRELATSAGYDGAVIDFDALVTTIRMRHGATPYFGALRDDDFTLLI